MGARLTSMTDTVFTAEEAAHFTITNAAAFDLLRTQPSRPPMWLCMSEEAREDARVKLAARLGVQRDDLDEKLRMFGASIAGQDCLSRWRAMELEAKRLRDAGEPRAYFA